MSGFADFPGSEVRARLDHPVIDCDAHVVEARFAIEDFLKDLIRPRASGGFDCHTAAIFNAYRNSPTNYVFNYPSMSSSRAA
jgi:hypothetical protein